MPGLAALSVRVQFVNDHAPTVTVDTLSDSGQAEVHVHSPRGTFVAHVSASDPNRGLNGHVTCRLQGSYGDRFRLVRMFDGEYKILTERSFDVAGIVVVSVSCRDHGDPPLSTLTNISVTITAADGVNSPVFSQTVYNTTLSVASRAPVFVIRVLAAESRRNVSYSFARSYPAFSVGRTTGVVRMVAAPSEATTTELIVVATEGGGGSTRATVYVSLVRPEQVAFSKRTNACRVREDAERGTSVCSLADSDTTMAVNRCLYYDLVDAGDGAFWADPINGMIHTNGSLDRELTSRFRLTARVQLDVMPTRVVDVLLNVDVEDVNDWAPQFIFPSPGNDTVEVDTAAVRQPPVAVVSAVDRDASENGRVTYSFVANNSDSQYFVVAASTGEVQLSMVDRLDNLINRSFVLYVAASDQGRPPLHSVAVLHIILPAGTTLPPQNSELESDSTLVVLAGVLTSFVVIAVFIGIAIFVVCCKSRQRQKSQSPNNGGFFPRVLMEPSQSSDESRCTSSTSTICPKPATTDVDKTPHPSPPTVDEVIDYFQLGKV